MTATGTIFEGYRLLRDLGGGWLGQVYAAQNLDGAQVSALRVIAPELTAQPQVMTQFRRLFEKWRRLAHPGILTPGELMEREHRAHYGMTLAQSGSARQLLQAQAREGQFLDLLIAVDIARQAAAALAYAHDANLMHGNLKPENLLLTPARAILGRQAYGVLVSDFGLGELQAFTHGTHDRLIVTTPAYMSPEQCRGVRTEVRSDLYTLGIILYELLTNLVPFETRDLADAIDKHQHVAAIPPGQIRVDIPQDLEEVVLTCLAKAPEYRYADAHALEDALQGVLSNLLPQGPSPTVVLPDIPEPPLPRIEPLRDRTPYPRVQICNTEGRQLRVEPLQHETTTLGRAPGNTVVLEHAGVSRHHLNIEVTEDGTFVTDLGSTNGTTLNAEPLDPRVRTPWPDGGILRVEPFWLRLQPPQRVVQQARIGVLVEDNEINLKPGELHNLKVQLANTGRTVDHFRLEVEGVPQEWVQNLYHEVQLNPGMTTEATMKVLVPRESRYHAGVYPMKVIARSRENPADFGYAPMDWTVLEFTETRLEMTPRRRSAWRRTHYDLKLTNASNVPITYNPTVRDDEGQIFLQSPWDMMRIPPTGDLRNIIPWRTILYNYWMRLREGVGKVRIEPIPQEVLVQPGEHFEHRIQARLPIRWIASPMPRTLRLHPQPDRGFDHPDNVSLLHLPVIPLWALPLIVIFGFLFLWWLFQTPTIVVAKAVPENPKVGEPFRINYETRNTWRTVFLWDANKRPLFSSEGHTDFNQGITKPTEFQIIAYGRVKTAQLSLTVTPKFPAPVVKTFSADPPNITSGQRVTIKWDVANVKEVNIDPFGTVPAKGERRSDPITQDTVFRLTAQGGQGGESVTLNRPVKVLPAKIDLFSLQPEEAGVGQTVTLTWRVLNADSVTLSPVGDVASSGSVKLKVSGEQTYTLTAKVGDKEVTQSKTVKLLAPSVEQFEVVPSNAKTGETVTIRWRVKNATSVNIDGIGTVPPQGEKQVTAQSNITYRLSAGNGKESTDISVPLTVSAKPPKVLGFRADPRKPRSGQPVRLLWQTQDAATVELSGPQGTQILPASGSTTITAPGDSAELTLTAKNSEGASDAQTLSLPVLPAAPKPAPKPPVAANPPPSGGTAGNTAGGNTAVKPPTPPAQPKPPTPPPAPPVARIVTFSVRPASVVRGQPVTLRWNVRGAKQVTISPLGRSFGPQGSLTLTPGSDTTYILTAGKTSAREPVRVRAPAPTPPQAVTPPAQRPAQQPAQRPAQTPTPPPAPPTQANTQPTPPVTPTQPEKPKVPAATPPSVVSFTATPATVGKGDEVTLRWEVKNARRVVIIGLGTVEASGSAVRTLQRDTQFTLRATAPGAAAAVQTASVNVTGGAGSGPERVAGTWQHPFGTLNLSVRGNTVSGSFNNLRTGDEGRVTGTLTPSSSGSYTLNGKVSVPSKPAENISFLVVINDSFTAFSGPYSSRVARERWCGWRPGSPPPAECN